MNVPRARPQQFERVLMRPSSSGSTYTSGDNASLMSHRSGSILNSLEDSHRSSRSSSSANSRSSRRSRRPYTQNFRYPKQLHDATSRGSPKPLYATANPSRQRPASHSTLDADHSVLSGLSRSNRSARSQANASASGFQAFEGEQQSLSQNVQAEIERSSHSVASRKSKDRHGHRHNHSERSISARSTRSVSSRASGRSRKSAASSQRRPRGDSLERDISKAVLQTLDRDAPGFWNEKEPTRNIGNNVDFILKDLDDTEASILGEDASHFSSVLGARSSVTPTRHTLPSVISEEQGSSCSRTESELFGQNCGTGDLPKPTNSFDAFLQQRARVLGKESSATPDTSQESDVGSRWNSSPNNPADKPLSPKSNHSSENPFTVLVQPRMLSPPIWSSSGESVGRASSLFASHTLSTSEWEKSPSKSSEERVTQNAQTHQRQSRTRTFFGTSAVVSENGWTTFDDSPFGNDFSAGPTGFAESKEAFAKFRTAETTSNNSSRDWTVGMIEI